jgi:hypothetical protein
MITRITRHHARRGIAAAGCASSPETRAHFKGDGAKEARRAADFTKRGETKRS